MNGRITSRLTRQVLASLNNVSELETKLDTKVFDLYGLSEPQRSAVLDSFSSD